MTDQHQDLLLKRLAAADPAVTEAAPRPGSPRYHAIQETAMSSTIPQQPTQPAQSSRPRPKRRWTMRLVPVAAVTTVAAVAVAVGIDGVDRESFDGAPTAASAAERVRSAAQQTGAATTLRGRMVIETGGRREVSNIAVAQRDVRIDDSAAGAFVYVDGLAYERNPDGQVTSTRLAPKDRLAPFAASSEAVVAAALTGKAVEVGKETVRGQDAVHYRIDLDAGARKRLEALSPTQLAWFELEYPEQLRAMDVWVGEGVIRRIRLDSTEGKTPVRSTTEFYDFGADIKIQALK